MRTQLACIALGMLLAAQSAYSADVAYRLDEANLSTDEPSPTPEPDKIAFVNCEWVTPGVEQASKRFWQDRTGRSRTQRQLPPIRFEDLGHQGFRIEAAPDSRWPVTPTQFVSGEVPDFAKDAWPLTRTLYGHSDVPRKLRRLDDDCSEYVFGEITFCR